MFLMTLSFGFRQPLFTYKNSRIFFFSQIFRLFIWLEKYMPLNKNEKYVGLVTFFRIVVFCILLVCLIQILTKRNCFFSLVRLNRFRFGWWFRNFLKILIEFGLVFDSIGSV